jgi:hypothetical protein
MSVVVVTFEPFSPDRPIVGMDDKPRSWFWDERLLSSSLDRLSPIYLCPLPCARIARCVVPENQLEQVSQIIGGRGLCHRFGHPEK